MEREMHTAVHRIVDEPLPNRDTLIVNSLGEVFIDNRPRVGSINMGALEKRIKREATKEDVEREFDRIAQVQTGQHYRMVRLVWDAQKKYDERSSFIRVQHYRGALRVSSEFKCFHDEALLLLSVYQCAAVLHAEVLIMDDGFEMDRVSYDKGKTWINGDNHNRPYLQLDVSLIVTPATMKGIDVAFANMDRECRKVWEQSGVSVI